MTVSEEKEKAFDELSVCSTCDICLQGFAALCDVMCGRLRNCKRKKRGEERGGGRGSSRKEDITLLVLALSDYA